jgi:hypothetical protein
MSEIPTATGVVLLITVLVTGLQLVVRGLPHLTRETRGRAEWILGFGRGIAPRLISVARREQALNLGTRNPLSRH